MYSGDLMLLLLVWLVGALLQVSVGPVIALWSGKVLVDGGWAVGRLGGWLVIGLVVWFLAYLQIPINTNNGVWLVTSIVVVGSGLMASMNRDKVGRFLRERWRVIVIEEVLFLFGLVFMVLVRGYNPRILDLEKFMDVGFMNSYLQASVFPAGDMWLSGMAINYYSFGHFLGSVMVRLWDVRMAYGYNLLLGWLMGLVMSLTFSLVVNIARFSKNVRSKLNLAEIMAGLVGSCLVTFGGNSHAVWYWINHKGFDGYWYADATRFIPRTIHEFPSYSFVVSDLHAHLWGLPIALLLMLLMVGWGKAKKRKVRMLWSVPMGMVMGIMVMANTWDVLVYGLMALIYGFLMVCARRIRASDLMLTLIVGAIFMIATAAPWWISFEPISQGVRRVVEGSTARDLAVLWAGHVGFSALALIAALRQKKRNWLVVGAVLTAWALLIIPEVIYVKDIYPDHPRANTMFKLTYQAFVVMSVMIGVLVAGVNDLKMRVLVWGLVAVGVFGSVSYSALAFSGYYPEMSSYVGLDGEKWLADESPDDYAGILWLRENAVSDSIVLEAVGESYTKHARVSAFTGRPTVLGWRVHEWLWRGGFEIPGERTEEVRIVYENPSSNLAEPVISKYGIDYIFVGEREREVYSLTEVDNISRIGEVVFRSGGTYIVKL